MSYEGASDIADWPPDRPVEKHLSVQDSKRVQDRAVRVIWSSKSLILRKSEDKLPGRKSNERLGLAAGNKSFAGGTRPDCLRKNRPGSTNQRLDPLQWRGTRRAEHVGNAAEGKGEAKRARERQERFVCHCGQSCTTPRTLVGESSSLKSCHNPGVVASYESI